MTDWRARKKAATRRAIQDHALRLFAAKGYDATTVEEIAAAAGVSHTTFFRYFPQKEAVVDYDEYDPLMRRLITERPAAEAPLVALHAAVRDTMATILVTDRDTMLARIRLELGTPSLRSRLWIAAGDTRELFARALAHRAGHTEPDLAATAQAGAALAANGAALAAWAGGADEDLPGLLDRAYAAIGVPIC